MKETREKEKEREREGEMYVCIYIYKCILQKKEIDRHIYIYIHIHIQSAVSKAPNSKFSVPNPLGTLEKFGRRARASRCVDGPN